MQNLSNVEVLDRIGHERQLLNRIKLRKLRYFGHIARHPSIESDLTLEMMPGTGRLGGQRRQWLDDVKDWARMGLPDLVHLEEDRKGFSKFIHRTVKAQHGVLQLQTCTLCSNWHTLGIDLLTEISAVATMSLSPCARKHASQC